MLVFEYHFFKGEGYSVMDAFRLMSLRFLIRCCYGFQFRYFQAPSGGPIDPTKTKNSTRFRFSFLHVLGPNGEQNSVENKNASLFLMIFSSRLGFWPENATCQKRKRVFVFRLNRSCCLRFSWYWILKQRPITIELFRCPVKHS